MNALHMANQRFDQYEQQLNVLQERIKDHEETKLALQQECAGHLETIADQRDKNCKKQRRINDLEKSIANVKESLANWKAGCMCAKRLNKTRVVPFRKLRKTQKIDVLATTRKFVTAGADDPEAEWQAFLSEALTSGPKLAAAAARTIKAVMESKKLVAALNKQIEKAKKKASRDVKNKAIDYIMRKKSHIGRSKKKKNLECTVGHKHFCV